MLLLFTYNWLDDLLDDCLQKASVRFIIWLCPNCTSVPK